MSAAAAAAVQAIPSQLPDIQAERPQVPIALDEAGISDLRYPITVHLSDGSHHQTVADVSLAASVAAEIRGVHMSRFVELLHDWRDRISIAGLPQMLAEVRERLDAEHAFSKFLFPLFLERAAPVTGSRAFVPYDCELEGLLGPGEALCRLTTRVPVKSLCPCSREISDYGAHNQRGSVEISVELAHLQSGPTVDFQYLIGVAEQAGSTPIFSVLKRPDERHVTMRAYENPAFVEDITRAVVDVLQTDPGISSGRVRVVNEESIHSHNAFASVTWRR